MKTLKLISGSVLLAFALIATSCEKDEDNNSNPAPAGQKTIAEIATENGNFTILLDALNRTGLTATVADASQTLTVFAPTDDAFVDLLAELGLSNLDEVENALGTEGLKNVLLYHVLGAVVTSDMVTTGYVSTLATNASDDVLSLYANASNGLEINERAKVDIADLEASNGVIHVIDQVILPLTIYDLISVNPDYATLTVALGIADGDLDALLSGPSNGPFTLLAPQEDAFANLLTELNLPNVEALVNTLGTDGLSNVLTYHVVSGNINRNELPSGNVATVNGQQITIDLSDNVIVTDSQSRTSEVVAIDIQGTNGVVHGINTVILPNF